MNERKKLDLTELEKIRKLSDVARGSILKMTTVANSGHPGGSMSSIDFLITLYHLIKVDPKNPKWEERDRVVISHGHISPAVYSTLGMMKFFDLEDAISTFRLAGSIFEGHVEPGVPGIEWASGNLGQGLSAGVGFALGCRQKGIKNNIYVLMGDGEQQKGQISEARRFAIKYNLNNITAFVDYNKLQICGDINKVMPQNIKENYFSDGWKVIEINGHDFSEIQDALFRSEQNEKPTLILANTVMGKGVSFMENDEKYHGSTISELQLISALKELSLENDFVKYKILRKKFETENLKKKKKKQLNNCVFNTGNPLVYSKKTDNRSAWGNAITDIARLNSNTKCKNRLAVFDCDLLGSVKTNKFAEEFPENIYESGIMEHHTAVAAGAMSKEGIQTFFADFGVFGVDETYNQHRLNDINETNLKVITTHVGLDVGEDGKTHQCIDYFGLIKNLYNFKMIIPADPNQTDKIIRYIVNEYGNFLIPMGRSKLDILKDEKGNIFYDENYSFVYGKADLLRPGTDASMFVMGTLTNRAIEIHDKLNELGISLQVWNIACPSDPDEAAIQMAVKTGIMFTYEDHNVNTGLGNSISDQILQMGLKCEFHKFGVEDYAFSGKSSNIFQYCKLDIDSIIKRITKIL